MAAKVIPLWEMNVINVELSNTQTSVEIDISYRDAKVLVRILQEALNFCANMDKALDELNKKENHATTKQTS